MQKLIVFSGLPGVGKTTLAMALSHSINATYLRIDTIEQALLRCKLNAPIEDAGYQVAYDLARENLLHGQDVIADSVNPIKLSRVAWTEVAAMCGAQLIQVEVICSDAAEHRRRVEARIADIKNHRLPTWQEVQDRVYEPWTVERIVIDTAYKTIPEAFSFMQLQLK